MRLNLASLGRRDAFELGLPSRDAMRLSHASHLVLGALVAHMSPALPPRLAT